MTTSARFQMLDARHAMPDASALMHVSYASAVKLEQPALPTEEPRERFARVIRHAREQRGWNQEELADAAGVSRPTVQRYEGGKTATPDAETSRRIFRALDLDPRLIPVVLGYVTAEEMGLPAEQPRVFSATVEEAIRILEDPRVPAVQKAEWLEFLRFRTVQGQAQVTGRGAVTAQGTVTGPEDQEQAG
jgi:transcriptional regulator with XRE-family HTH domain